MKLDAYMKEYDVRSGVFIERAMFSVYVADWQFMLHVWLPEVNFVMITRCVTQISSALERFCCDN